MQVLRIARGAAVIAAVGLPVGLLAHSAEAGPDIKYNTVVLTDDEAVGTGGGEYQNFAGLRINDSGEIAYRANLRVGVNGVEVSNNVGVWSTNGGVLGLDWRKDDIAPGTGGARLGNVNASLAFTDSGDFVFETSLIGSEVGIDGTNNKSIWSSSGGSLDLIARYGDAAPGAGGAAFGNWLSSRLLFNTSGDVAFRAELSLDAGLGVDNSNRVGVWATGGGALSLIARAGSDAPGTGGADFSNFDADLAMNNSGQVAFEASLLIGQNGVTSDNGRGLWSNTSGSLALVARAGDLAPGAGNAEFFLFFKPSINDSGDLVFRGALSQGVGGVDTTNNSGIWSSSGGTMELQVRRGDAAPGAGAARFDTFSEPRLNASGDIFFSGRLVTGENGVDATNDSCLWAITDDTATLIAREGADAPGAGGADYGQFNGINTFNDIGDFVFVNTLQTGENGVDNTNDRGIWAYSASLDEILLIAREGDLFDVSNDPLVPDLRTIQSLSASSLNNSGVLIFGLNFTDGSRGVFTASIPAPGAAGLLTLAGLAASRRRR